MMRIMAIGSSAIDTELFCGATLAKFAREGHQVSVIIVPSNNDYAKHDVHESGIALPSDTNKSRHIDNEDIISDLTLDEARALFARRGIKDLHFVSKFDYSSVTQENAEILSAQTNRIKPELVIIPFWKTQNSKDRVLSRSALVACRGIGSVLMYNREKDMSHFRPDVTFDIAPNLGDDIIQGSTSLREGIMGLQGSHIISDNQNTISNNFVTHPYLPLSSPMDKAFTESFESHRLLLLEDEENGWL